MNKLAVWLQRALQVNVSVYIRRQMHTQLSRGAVSFEGVKADLDCIIATP